MQVTKCVCGCGAISINHAGWYYVPQRNRGGRDAYMCPKCARKQGGEDVTLGKQCGGGVAYRVMFPATHTSAAAQAYALKNDWRRVGDGYVSPEWRNLNSAKKQFITWEIMMADGEIALKDNIAPIMVSPWGGFNYRELATIADEFGELFNQCGARIGTDCIMLNTRFFNSASFMDTMKTAKAMMLALLAWLEKPTASRAAKVRRYFNVAAYPDGMALPIVGLPA